MAMRAIPPSPPSLPDEAISGLSTGRGPVRDVIVIGGSAGAVPALRTVFARIPVGFRASIFVVVHRSPYADDHLARVIVGRSQHPIVEPADGERIEKGTVYLAPRDRHLLLEADRMRLARDPKEHYTRPAIDPLFRSAAATFGPRVVGVVLTGMGHDGMGGLVAIKAAGGVSIVQDPRDAEYDPMPRQAVDGDAPDAVLPIDALAERLAAMLAVNGSAR